MLTVRQTSILPKVFSGLIIKIILIIVIFLIISIPKENIAYMHNQEKQTEMKTENKAKTETKTETETVSSDNNTAVPLEALSTEKLNKLAAEYNADPEYLNYIVQVEKTFNLEPCGLLALIAQETGFKPQTHMDGGTLSYSATQMKLATAKTAYMAITEYYKMEIPYPTHQLLLDNKDYAAFLAGGYLRYLNDTYNDKYESYTAYNRGIGGRLTYYNNNGHFKSPYAVKVANLEESFIAYIGQEYENI